MNGMCGRVRKGSGVAGVVLTGLMCALVLWGCGGGQATPEVDEGARAASEALAAASGRIAVDFPAGWERKDGFMGTAVVGLSAEEGARDPFRENASVAVYPKGKAGDMPAFAEGFGKDLQAQLNDYALLSSDETRMGGYPARALVYEYQQGVNVLRTQTVMVLRGDYVYALTFTALNSSYDRFRPKFDDILASVRFADAEEAR